VNREQRIVKARTGRAKTVAKHGESGTMKARTDDRELINRTYRVVHTVIAGGEKRNT
jgi:hypothetical protein